MDIVSSSFKSFNFLPYLEAVSGFHVVLFMFCTFAATGPNPLVGRPRQGPGVLPKDPQMDGTWAPSERGVTATSSKCPVFKETEGELSPSQMFHERFANL